MDIPSASASRVHKEMTKNKPTHNARESYNYFLATIFPHDEMQIMGIIELSKISVDSAMNNLLVNLKNLIFKNYQTKEVQKERFSFTMLLENSWYCLTASK